MIKEEKQVSLVEAIAHQILQIQIAERSISDAVAMGGELAGAKYLRLKKEYIQQLNEMRDKANLR